MVGSTRSTEIVRDNSPFFSRRCFEKANSERKMFATRGVGNCLSKFQTLTNENTFQTKGKYCHSRMATHTHTHAHTFYLAGTHLPRVLQSRRHGETVREHAVGDDGQREGLHPQTADRLPWQHRSSTLRVSHFCVRRGNWDWCLCEGGIPNSWTTCTPKPPRRCGIACFDEKFLTDRLPRYIVRVQEEWCHRDVILFISGW